MSARNDVGDQAWLRAFAIVALWHHANETKIIHM